MKQNDKVMTPAGPARVTEVHANGKTVKVEMWGTCVKGVWSWPKPFVQTFPINKINKINK